MTSPASGSAPASLQPSWGVMVLLGAIALIRPLLRITGIAGDDGAISASTAAVTATIAISVVWIAVVLAVRVPRPFLTLVGAGLVYAVLSTLLSAILSPLVDGEFRGPLANPIAIVPMLLVNLVWGAVCGGIASGLRALLRAA